MRRSRSSRSRCGTRLAPPRVLQRLRGEHAATPCTGTHKSWRSETAKPLELFRYPHRHAKQSPKDAQEATCS